MINLHKISANYSPRRLIGNEMLRKIPDFFVSYSQNSLFNLFHTLFNTLLCKTVENYVEKVDNYS